MFLQVMHILLLQGSATALLAVVDTLLNLQQFNDMVPQTTVTHLPSDILIIHNQLVIPISIINGLTAQPLHVIKWIAQEERFIRFDQQVWFCLMCCLI